MRKIVAISASTRASGASAGGFSAFPSPPNKSLKNDIKYFLWREKLMKVAFISLYL